MSRRNIKQARKLEPKMVSVDKNLSTPVKPYGCAQTCKGKCERDEELGAAKKIQIQREKNSVGNEQCPGYK